MPEARPEERSWKFTVVRAHGLHKLRAERSWRPIVVVTVGDHQCQELSLGSDGQNPNLKECFHFRDVDVASRITICVYHLAQSKKKNRRRNLVATACCTLQELARLQAQQQCKQKSVQINLSCVQRQRKESKSKPSSPVLLVAKFDLPAVFRQKSMCIQEDTELEVLSDCPEDQEYSSSSVSDSSEGPISVLSEEPEHRSEPKVQTSYWPDSDAALSGDEREPLLKHQSGEPTLVVQLSDNEGEDDAKVKRKAYRTWLAASILPSHTETISRTSTQLSTSTVDSIVDSFSPYRELREARHDSDFERILSDFCTEWRFVGGSLVALSGLEAGVFGFSSASTFKISNFARRAIAIGSVASGIGLTIDAWFLLVYCNATSTKFQKWALDVYGTYMFFCISARMPALCLFTSAFALMTFLISVAWDAWPTAVLVMIFFAGVLFGLQFVVYSVHCVVVVIAGAARRVRNGLLSCLAWARPSPVVDEREKTEEK